MNKKKITMNALVGIIGVAAPIATAVSCSETKGSESWKNSKTIVVTVDGAQKKMYEQAIKEFNKTDAHTKHGYKIKTINKNVFGALDMVKTVGFTDENVGDLLYMPQDRMTDMLQQKALMPWTDSRFDNLIKKVGAAPKEIANAKKFESTKYKSKDVVFGFPHNKEGITISTAKNATDATSDLKSKGILGLQNEAKGLFRLQDMWYGAGLFATPTGLSDSNKQTLTKLILYGDGSDWKSAFIKGSEGHDAMKKVTDMMADMWFEPLAKAYISGASAQLIGSAWKNSAITSDALKNFFQSDMNAVNNMLLDAASTGKLDYIQTGTWDAQVMSKRGLRTLVNIPSDVDGSSASASQVKFKQASGTWSYGINARNNGADKSRIDAIYTLLECIYSKDSFTQYFNQDTKIPWFKSLQKSVKTEVGKLNAPKIADAVALYDRLVKDGVITQPSTPLTEGTAKVEALAEFLKTKNQSFNDLKDLVVNSEWKGAFDPSTSANATAPKFAATQADDKFNVYAQNPYLDAEGLVDAQSAILGIASPVQGIPEWQISETSLKKPYDQIDEGIKVDKTNKTVHIRKLAKIWAGFDNDNSDETKDMVKEFAIDTSSATTKEAFKAIVDAAKLKFDAKVTQQISKAKTFSSEYTKGIVAPAIIEEAVKKYMANFWNVELRNAQYSFILKNAIAKTIISGANTTPPISLDQASTMSQKASKTLSLNEVYDVISSSTGDVRGAFETQADRFDGINPQFASVWDLWNGSTFGNKIFLKQAIENATANNTTRTAAEGAFKITIENHLSKLFSERVKALKAANAQGIVKID